MEQKFKAIVQKVGKRVGIQLPFDPNEIWGEKARHDVHGTVNEIRIRGPIFSEADEHYMLLGPAWRRDCGIDVDSTVVVLLEPEGPQVTTMAEDLTRAFAAAPTALAVFNSLPTFYRKNYMRWVNSAKRAETRAKRITEMITLLNEGKRER